MHFCPSRRVFANTSSTLETLDLLMIIPKWKMNTYFIFNENETLSFWTAGGLGLLHQTPIRLLISFDGVNILETNVCPVYSRKTDHFCRIHLMLLVEIRFRGIETQRGPRDFGSSLADFSITWTAIGQFLGAWEPYRIGL